MANEDVSSAFARLADSLPFELRYDAFETGEHTDIGLFAGPLASPVMNFAVTHSQAPLNQNDDQAIESVVRGWESLEPSAYKGSFEEFANDPYLLIGAGSVGQVEGGSMGTNEEFESVLQSYPVYSPRRSTVSNVQIVHIGGRRAAVTYVVSEEYTNGSSYQGNAVAVLAKLQQGWRIVIATDHLTA